MLNTLDAIGENMTIEEFVKSLTYEQKRELLWVLFYDACEISRSTEDMTPYLTDSPTPMFSKSSQECGVSIGRKSTGRSVRNDG